MTESLWAVIGGEAVKLLCLNVELRILGLARARGLRRWGELLGAGLTGEKRSR